MAQIVPISTDWLTPLILLRYRALKTS